MSSGPCNLITECKKEAELAVQEPLFSAYQKKWLWYITFITCGLPDMYTQSLRATGPRDSGVHIRQTTRIHGITITCTSRILEAIKNIKANTLEYETLGSNTYTYIYRLSVGINIFNSKIIMLQYFSYINQYLPYKNQLIQCQNSIGNY